jgi:NAD(P)H dehydrogenase (quinone)
MTGSVNVAVIYYSATGHTAAIAHELAEAAQAVGATVRVRRVPELAPPEAIAANPQWAAHAAESSTVEVVTGDDVVWADAVLMGSPTRFGNIASQLKQFLDTLGPLWQQGLLADKVYSAFTSTGTTHGGQESTLLALMQTFHHFGGVVVAPGYTDPAKFADGNPYGTSFCDDGGTSQLDDVTRKAAAVQAARVVRMARALRQAR